LGKYELCAFNPVEYVIRKIIEDYWSLKLTKKDKEKMILIKRLFFVMFIFFAVFWSASNKSQKSESNARFEVIDGVEYIHNTETPLHPDKTVTFEEDFSISGEDKDGDIILFNPRISLVDDNENIYFKETKDQVIKVFDSDGKFIRTIGSKGNGPGEFQLILNLAITKDGKLLVTDQTARRTSFFDSSGQFLKSFQWLSRYSSCYLIKSSSYLTAEIFTGDDRQSWFFLIIEVDFDGKKIRSYGKFTMPEIKITRQGNGTSFMFVPFSPESIFAGDQERGLLYHCLNNKYIIEVYDTSGKLFRKIDRPYESIPLTSKDVKDYLEKYVNDPSGVLKKAFRDMEMPKVKNVVTKMLVDDECKLWIRTSEKKKVEDKILTAFDIFDSNGQYYARIWTEFTSFIFKKGKLYRMDTDQETGYQTLKRYKVVWK